MGNFYLSRTYDINRIVQDVWKVGRYSALGCNEGTPYFVLTDNHEAYRSLGEDEDPLQKELEEFYEECRRFASMALEDIPPHINNKTFLPLIEDRLKLG